MAKLNIYHKFYLFPVFLIKTSKTVGEFFKIII